MGRLTKLFGLRNPDGEPWLYWHSQNLNEKNDGTVGPCWHNWRSWISFHGFGPRDRNRHGDPSFGFQICLCPYLRNRELEFSVSLETHEYGDDYDVSGHVILGRVVAFYWHFEDVWTRTWAEKLERWGVSGRGTRISLCEEFLWLDVLSFEDSWRDKSRFWKGIDLSWDWKTFLMGKLRFSKKNLGTRELTVCFPEGSYSITVQAERCTWKRDRWPWNKFPRIRTDSGIEIPGGIPIPGKGENSWDCGEDRLYGTGSKYLDDANIIGDLVRRVLEIRSRHGGSVNWEPREKVGS